MKASDALKKPGDVAQRNDGMTIVQLDAQNRGMSPLVVLANPNTCEVSVLPLDQSYAEDWQPLVVESDAQAVYSDMRSLVADLESENARLTEALRKEKSIRVGYQDRVYALCSMADDFLGRSVVKGEGTTVESLLFDLRNFINEMRATRNNQSSENARLTAELEEARGELPDADMKARHERAMRFLGEYAGVATVGSRDQIDRFFDVADRVRAWMMSTAPLPPTESGEGEEGEPETQLGREEFDAIQGVEKPVPCPTCGATESCEVEGLDVKPESAKLFADKTDEYDFDGYKRKFVDGEPKPDAASDPRVLAEQMLEPFRRAVAELHREMNPGKPLITRLRFAAKMGLRQFAEHAGILPSRFSEISEGAEATDEEVEKILVGLQTAGSPSLKQSLDEYDKGNSQTPGEVIAELPAAEPVDTAEPLDERPACRVMLGELACWYLGHAKVFGTDWCFYVDDDGEEFAFDGHEICTVLSNPHNDPELAAQIGGGDE